ncbi:hypothetical protein [Haloterrigena alkaliphila]|uniref:Uncharacterized protein n=1 Tax=Haloterrigena alkaliphila TaxID=2816475 RepID=A0A8A2VSF7_9EURY|nr:hypothetical protein [Haloterrigena alkaliphila]QSX00969.1 hypothetical protein J0X25_08435 [Haloterrigena alkaliphila]
MVFPRQIQFRTTVDAIHPGTTVRYHYRSGSSLATVVERTERYVTFVGPNCDGRFTHEQIDRLIEDDRLEVVLDDDHHVPVDAPEPTLSE